MAETVGILVTGALPSALAARHGPYDAMMRRLLGDGFTARSYDVRSGDLPGRVGDHGAYLITGSAAGVYDDLPWIAPLEGFIRAAHGRARLVGICFGHQAMAQALGGRVEKSARGWGLGLHGYDIVGPAPWMDDGPPRIAAVASHQYQVVAPPAGGAVLAASAFTPYAMLGYGDAALSMQFHPEFSPVLGADLVELRRPGLPDGLANRALSSLGSPGDAGRIGGWIRAFVQESAGPSPREREMSHVR